VRTLVKNRIKLTSTAVEKLRFPEGAVTKTGKPATRREPGSAAIIEVASATSTAAEPGNLVISSLRAGCDFDSGHGFVDASAAVAATPAP
jgi:hypothetical protein